MDADPLPVVGSLGIVLFALGYARTGRVPWTYRIGGAAVMLGALLVLTTLEGRFARFELEPVADQTPGTPTASKPVSPIAARA